MDDKKPIGSAVDQILAHIDLARIAEPATRECIHLLLNLIETLQAELGKAQAENQCLRQQLQGRRGGGGSGHGGQGEQDRSGGRSSSEKERREPGEAGEQRAHRKRSKLDRIAVDREEVLKLDRASLPADAEFKGYVDVVVQDLRITTDNVKFRKEKYYSVSTGQTYLAPLPGGYEGEYGPQLKSLCLLYSHLCNMTEPKIADLLANYEIVISAGQISRLLHQAQEPLQEEKKAIVEAGLSSTPWQHIDDTGTRVKGKNNHCHVLCNPLYTAYTTTPRKDRMTVIDVLRNQRERIFRFNAEAYEWLRQLGVSQRVQEAVQQLPMNQDWSEAELTQELAEQIPHLSPGVREQILEAAAIAAYHAETEHPVVQLLICDDAKQFRRVTAELALCWVHNGRHYQNLEPCVGYHRQGLEAFRKQYWDYYRALRAYQRAPAEERARELGQQFDQLFSSETGYQALDQRITKTKAQKEFLLKVLEHPEIPLHNNPAELAARWRVRKRVVSYGPRSLAGAQAWDTMETLLGTAKKLGVNFFQYIRDRLSGAKQMTSLAELIAEKAKTLDRGSFLESRGTPWRTNTIPVPG